MAWVILTGPNKGKELETADEVEAQADITGSGEQALCQRQREGRDVLLLPNGTVYAEWRDRDPAA